MATTNNRRPQPGRVTGETIALFVVLGLVMVALVTVYAAAKFGHQIAGLDPIPADPWETLFGVIKGDVAWPMASTVIAVAVLLVLLLLGGIAWWVAARRRSRSSRVDHAARYMGRGRDVEPLTHKAVAETAARLGVEGSPGVPIGRTLAASSPIFGSWEDMHIDIWGPRTGKTTSRAVPAILEAPGAVLVTSNKRDVLDATRDPRLAAGPVWVFDPQSVAREEPTEWWWSPLSYVTDEVRAAKLAEHFASGSRDPGARTDAFFDPSAQDLLAGLLLAAALDGRPITDVYRWLTRPTDNEPVTILQNGGYELTADQVAGVVFAPEKQRGGVYGTAQQMASCLTNRQVARWVTPLTSADHRRQFSPEAFVREGGTLYSLSKEGRGTAGPLVTALTVAVVEAAEELAAASPGGRLPTPLLGVLDEAANVCRWRELPNLYSHYGPPRDRPDDDSSVLVPGGRRVGRIGHAEALVREQHCRVRRRREGARVSRNALSSDRRLRQASHLGLHGTRTAQRQRAAHPRTYPGCRRPPGNAEGSCRRAGLRYSPHAHHDAAVDERPARRSRQGVDRRA